MRPKQAVLSWSSGKDSAFALHEILQKGEYQVVSLVTTLNEVASRVAMHGVREELLDLQAERLGMPLEKVRLPSPCSNAVYEERMLASLSAWKSRGVGHVIFGDLYLEDIRAYRRAQLAKAGLEGVFPLWRRDTAALARSMCERGFQAILSCVDLKKLPASFAGRAFDAALLDSLPPGIDPCGENGEFHSFVHAGPIFSEPIAISVGETLERDGFAFADLMAAGHLKQSRY